MEKKRTLTTMMTICVLLACLSAAAPGKVIYVDDGAAGANDGSSWANAFVRLQSAIYCRPFGGRDPRGPGPLQARPVLGRQQERARDEGEALLSWIRRPWWSRRSGSQAGVAIRGGFAGPGAEDPNARDFERYETILSGDLNGDDIAAWGLGHLMYESLRDDNSAVRGGEQQPHRGLDERSGRIHDSSGRPERLL